MLISDSYSDKTSNTLPIIISFSSQLKTPRTRRIRDFLKLHPNCKKYVTKGPNFVADGINEFRLYYVDSSLYSDGLTLKRLNVEKEEIMLVSTSEDSLEPTSIPTKQIWNRKKRNAVQFPIAESIKKVDKSTLCIQDSYIDLRCYSSVSDSPSIIKKVSKSFQIGPDLRFNVVYVNTDVEYHSLNHNTADVYVQTESLKSRSFNNCTPDSSAKFEIRCSPSFIIGNQSKIEKLEKKKFTTFKDFCSKMEEKTTICKMTDDSEFNIESKTTSVKFSIKKSPSFVANYILEILNTRRSNGNVVKSEIYEQSIVNYIRYDDLKKRISMRKFTETKNDIANCSEIIQYDPEITKNDKKHHRDEYKKTKHTHRKKGDRKKQNKYTKNCNKVDKLNRYQNISGTTNYHKVECLFKCTNMDFFYRKSHYAILKKYHRRIKEKRHKRENQQKRHGNRHGKTDKTQADNKLNKTKEHYKHKYNDQNKKVILNNCEEKKKHHVEDSRTRTTISGFLQSYKPWHWQDNSKLSVCIDEECFTEDYI